MDSTDDRRILGDLQDPRPGARPPTTHVPEAPPVPSPSRPPLGRIVHVRDPRGVPDLPVEQGRRPEDYEFQIITVPPRTSVGQVRAHLTEEAEYGRWELARTRRYLGGGKKVWMRRRIIRVRSTLGDPSGL